MHLEGVGVQEGGAEHGGVADEVAERAGRVGTRLVLVVGQQLHQRPHRPPQAHVQRRTVKSCAHTCAHLSIVAFTMDALLLRDLPRPLLRSRDSCQMADITQADDGCFRQHALKTPPHI